MALTKTQKKAFIKKVAKAVEAYAPRYGIRVYSPIIAQAILESGWGESALAAKYNNLFGLKCGTKWTGRSVNMQTQEEFSPGKSTTISDNFRAYDSFEEGVKGYFDFIQLPRYANLKGIDEPAKYCETIKADGYATDSKYVESLMSLIKEWGLADYDPVVVIVPDEEGVVLITPERTAEDYLAVWRSWVGKNERDGSFQEIIDIYNSHLPRARGYAVQYYDEWCDTTVSAAAIKAGMVDLIGTECGCEEHVKIFKSKGIWIEDGSVTPEPGDIIVFSWRTERQPNDSYSDHIGVVAAVKNGVITTIEGNKGEAVGYRTIPVGWGYIRGYARPKYGGSKPSQEVGGHTLGGVTTSTGSATIGKNPKWVGRVTATMLNVRTWAGTSYPNIKSVPVLSGGSLVEVCDEITAADGAPWYYVRINGTIYGFVSAAYIARM